MYNNRLLETREFANTQQICTIKTPQGIKMLNLWEIKQPVLLVQEGTRRELNSYLIILTSHLWDTSSTLTQQLPCTISAGLKLLCCKLDANMIQSCCQKCDKSEDSGILTSY